MRYSFKISGLYVKHFRYDLIRALRRFSILGYLKPKLFTLNMYKVMILDL